MGKKEIVYYVDQFRGFNSTFISVKRINFLVGENSTGKTSLLKLIYLLNDFNFWINLDFNQSEVELGTFDDILSKNSKSETFTIGLLTFNEKSYFATILRFGEMNGMPNLENHIVSIDGQLVSFDFRGEEIRYRNTNFSENDNFENLEPEELFKYIVEIEKSKSFQSKNYYNIKDTTNFNEPKILAVSSLISEEKILKGKGRSIFPLLLSKLNPYSWMAPIRAKPQQIYLGIKHHVSPEGNHTPFIFKSIVEKSNNVKSMEYLSKFGKESGLFEGIKTSSFGKSKTAPFELDIIRNSKEFKISSVGYGVSQVFPLVIEMIVRQSGSSFCIQQPEVHLHPKAQAAFGEYLFDISLSENKSFIIETHSDYLIDRFRFLQSKSEEKISSQVLFFKSFSDGNLVFPIKIKDSGKYIDEQPHEFREFFIDESIRVMDI